jgi:hypothetical protein
VLNYQSINTRLQSCKRHGVVLLLLLLLHPTVSQVPKIAPAVITETPFPRTSNRFYFEPTKSVFDPDLDESHEGYIVTIGKDLWFRDVFLFTGRLKDIGITKDVRTNWTACFRGIALTWYQSEWDGYNTLRKTKTPRYKLSTN